MTDRATLAQLLTQALEIAQRLDDALLGATPPRSAADHELTALLEGAADTLRALASRAGDAPPYYGATRGGAPVVPSEAAARDSEHQHLRDAMVRIAEALGHSNALILEVTCKEGETPAQRIAAEVEALVVRAERGGSLAPAPSGPTEQDESRFKTALQRLLGAHGDWVKYRAPHEEARNEDLATAAEHAEREVIELFVRASRVPVGDATLREAWKDVRERLIFVGALRETNLTRIAWGVNKCVADMDEALARAASPVPEVKTSNEPLDRATVDRIKRFQRGARAAQALADDIDKKILDSIEPKEARDDFIRPPHEDLDY